MIIVHAAIHGDGMFFWGESSQDDHPPKSIKASAGNQESGKVNLCTFGAGRKNVDTVFPGFDAQFKPDTKRFCDLSACLSIMRT
jgi:hypothetical protein